MIKRTPTPENLAKWERGEISLSRLARMTHVETPGLRAWLYARYGLEGVDHALEQAYRNGYARTDRPLGIEIADEHLLAFAKGDMNRSELAWKCGRVGSSSFFIRHAKPQLEEFIDKLYTFYKENHPDADTTQQDHKAKPGGSGDGHRSGKSRRAIYPVPVRRSDSSMPRARHWRSPEGPRSTSGEDREEA